MTTQPTHAASADEDLAEQALPGHGIPSQDPDSSAQRALNPEETQRETKSVLTGGGAVAGAATGAAIGGAVAGPPGIVVGAAVGAVVGALGGAVAATPTAEDPRGVDSDVAHSVHLHIEDSGGSGRPVVLIHGWPLSARAWEPQISALSAAGFRVVAYDRRGFGRSDKPASAYDYDVLADDLQGLLEERDLQDVTLVGFSMGGGEIARYISRHGEARLHSVVFASAVPPYLLHSNDNPEGPLQAEAAKTMRTALEQDRASFFEHFTKDFFSANGVLQVTESQRSEAIALCHQSSAPAALACMDAFGTTDFREDLKKVKVPTLVVHGDADAIVPIEGSGLRTHRAVPHSQMVRVNGAPHGLNVSHAQAFNDALLAFLQT
jgi:pimeloyl-ACP methyl ester carboxylesterase